MSEWSPAITVLAPRLYICSPQIQTVARLGSETCRAVGKLFSSDPLPLSVSLIQSECSALPSLGKGGGGRVWGTSLTKARVLPAA